jgi:hypothetical protein
LKSQRLTVSSRHVADPSLADKDGKQDTEEDDEKDELHGMRPHSRVETSLKHYASDRIIRLGHYERTVKGR